MKTETKNEPSNELKNSIMKATATATETDYPKLLSTQMTYNYKDFNTIIDSIDDIWKEVIINNYGNKENMSLAINVARHIRRIDPHNLWNHFIEKIEKDTIKYSKNKQIELCTKLILEVDDYCVHHFSLDHVLNKLLGSEAKSEIYFTNMNKLKYGFDSCVNVAICNANNERRNVLLVEKIQEKDYDSVNKILNTRTIQPSELRKIKIEKLSLEDYLQKKSIEYKEEILNEQSIKDIDKLFSNQLHDSKIGETVHTEILNYYQLEKIIKNIEKEIYQEDRIFYKKKM